VIATAFSLGSLLGDGKAAKDLGTAGTVLGVCSSLLHKLVTPRGVRAAASGWSVSRR
jgi:hypothetical protein